VGDVLCELKRKRKPFGGVKGGSDWLGCVGRGMFVGDARWPPIILVDGQRVLVCEPLVSGSSLRACLGATVLFRPPELESVEFIAPRS